MKPNLGSVLSRAPLRVRITVTSSASIAVILAALSLLVYARLHAELLRAIDSGLQARASAVASSVGQFRQIGSAISDGPDLRNVAAAQILALDGHVLAQSGPPIPALSPRYLHHLGGPAFVQVSGQALTAPMRLYLLPVDEGRPLVIV